MEAVSLSLPVLIIQHRAAILPVVPEAFQVVLRVCTAHTRAFPRSGRIVIGPTTQVLALATRLIARLLLIPESTLLPAGDSRLLARMLFDLEISTIIQGALWHGIVATGIQIGTAAATTFGVVTAAIGTTTPG